MSFFFHAKIQKNSMHWFLITAEKRHFGHIWGPFLAKKPSKPELSQKNYFWLTLSLYTTVTLCKNSKKLWISIFHKTKKKTRFRPILGPFMGLFGPKTSKQDFSQKIIEINFKTLCCCNFMQKQKKSHASIFHKTWKPHFGPISGPFDPKTLKNKIFPKKIICCNLQKNNEKKNYMSWFFAKLGKLHFGSFWTRTRFSSKNLMTP